MDIYLATVALEKNRWSTKEPSFEVSQFLPNLFADGFAGLELWENHYLLASPSEKERLEKCGVPMIFNTYARFDGGLSEQLEHAAEAICRLNAHAVKFNISASSTPVSIQLETLLQFAALLPKHVKLLSECHPGTLMEEPADAKTIFEQLPAERFGAIVHLAPVKGDNASRFELYGDRICHLHTQLRKPGTNERTRLDEQRGIARDYLRALRAWGFDGTISVEFTLDSDCAQATYENCKADLVFLKEALA